MLTIYLFLALVQNSAGVELLSSQDYSVKRFQEVIAEEVEKQNQSRQEKLISLRAKLAIAERKLDEISRRRALAATPQEIEEAPKTIHVRAARSRVDHYRLTLKSLESQTQRSRTK
jgi:hypothetical protein